MPGTAPARRRRARVRRARRAALRAERRVRHRQPDFQRAVVPARGAGARTGRRHRRRLHRRRSGSELFLHRPHPARRSLHRRHPARQPAAAPAVQGDLRGVAKPGGIPEPAHRPAGARSRRHLARREHREDRRLFRRARSRSATSALAGEGRATACGDQAVRRARVSQRVPDDRSISCGLRRRGPVAAVSFDRPSGARVLPDVSRSAARNRSPGPEALLSGVGRRLPVREGARSARRRDPGGRRPERPPRGGGHRTADERSAASACRRSTSRTSRTTCSATAASRGTWRT